VLRAPRAAGFNAMASNLPADVRKLLEWLDRTSPLLESQIVGAGFDRTLDKALWRILLTWARIRPCASMVFPRQVSITAAGRAALRKFPGGGLCSF
jgi:hypothetical protein